jgi:hypothetical protein
LPPGAYYAKTIELRDNKFSYVFWVLRELYAIKTANFLERSYTLKMFETSVLRRMLNLSERK